MWTESKGRLMQALSPPGSPKRAGSPSGSSTSSINDDDHARLIQKSIKYHIIKKKTIIISSMIHC